MYFIKNNSNSNNPISIPQTEIHLLSYTHVLIQLDAKTGDQHSKVPLINH